MEKLSCREKTERVIGNTNRFTNTNILRNPILFKDSTK